jgi:hypothetical protein
LIPLLESGTGHESATGRQFSTAWKRKLRAESHPETTRLYRTSIRIGLQDAIAVGQSENASDAMESSGNSISLV